MKTVKLSDFSPYDRNKGGIQELHHKIEPKTLQYWGEDSGIGPVLRAARPSRGTWSSPVASRAPATSTSETWFGR